MTTDAWTHHKSVFADRSVWTYRYACSLHLSTLTGGTPSNPRVAKNWLATRLGGEQARDQMLEGRLRETMVERLKLDPTLSADEVMQEALTETAVSVNGFKRTPGDGHLHIEGRHVKAMLKEAASIGLGSDQVPVGVGTTRKGAASFVAEHVMVEEDVLVLHRDGEPLREPDEVQQSFVHPWSGKSGIDYHEVVHGVDLDCTVITDLDLTALKFGTKDRPRQFDLWPVVWTLAEQNGLGARRSQGSGKFVVTRWDRLTD